MKKKILSLILCAALLNGTQEMAWASAETYSEGEIHTIGVAMYDPDSAEMEMFASYYRDYIEAGFPVKFIFSGKIADTQAESVILLMKRKQTEQRESFLLPDLRMDFRMS